MRPIASEQDSLRYPLNELFGTQAHVRLLRVMTNEVDGSLTLSDIARRAGLTVPGAKKALDKLFRSGFVSRVGGGRSHQYEIRSSERIMQVVLELFRTEKKRYDDLLFAIKKGITNLRPYPHASWMEAHVCEIGEPLTVCLLQDSLHVTKNIRQLREKLNQVEDEFDITIELKGYTKADLPDVQSDGIINLYGILPDYERSVRKKLHRLDTHEEKDRQLIAISKKLATAIEKDSSLLRRAKEHVDWLLKESQGTATRDLEEWRSILEKYSIPRLSKFLTSSSERASRLRQSNPFFAVLNQDECQRFGFDEEDH